MKSEIICCLLFWGVIAHTQTTYFVDNLIGDDTNKGISKKMPFKSMEIINKVHLKPGDSVLFRRGGQWIGNLIPRGSGSKKASIVIGAYGYGKAPVLDAKGMVAINEKASHTIRLFNQDYIEIRDLKIRNYKASEEPRKLVLKHTTTYVNAPKNGIYIEAKDCGTLHNIHLINLEICDVNGDMSTKNNGGVFAEITWNKDVTKRVKSNFEGLYTEGCYIHDVDRTGWSNRSVWNRRSLYSKRGDTLANGSIHNWYPSKQIVHRNNKFERAGANALIVRVASSPVVTYCSFKHNGLKGSGNASFPFNCDDALFQYNEASYTFYNTEATSWDHKPDVDAGGFDSDWNCKNTIIQYNYSHHNGHGGILICCNGTSKTSFNDGTIIRYNIFESNNHHIVRNSGTTTNTKIYNNVFFAGKEQDAVQLLYHKSWGGFPDTTSYTNNIFYALGEGNEFDLGKSTNNMFEANTFYGNIKNEPEDEAKSKENPLFIRAIDSETNWKPYLRFILQIKSPEIDTGIDIAGHPMKDFLGNPIIGKPDRGVFEKHNNN
ncbi:right-handed parallel beta-helix repeat-containing protein [Flavivirga jejuensis]|uniref:Right-handed parallel beta-helix repeat-containing protein n=1 Tax=Flavivirga jejuensis TaxID=870487 RepID=A0ABT8WMR3_9FLAO|nr:right-handed parallel beta-helix repeat-containing protein [Flavivirga jejuensis]MDO5974274.1 right-handed parallel beta-helix repeat-containing protein [Flavivirga jejuensis]